MVLLIGFKGSLKGRSENWKDILGWWLLAVCNDFGFWLTVTAAHDLVTVPKGSIIGARQCNPLPAGIILLVGTVPSFLSSIVLVFLPLWINTRVTVAVALSITAYVLFASSNSWTSTLIGVGITSASLAIGASTLVAYLSRFSRKSVVSAWSSGIGASGFLSSLLYTLLKRYGVTLSTMAKYMVLIPLVLVLAYWGLVSKPEPSIDSTEKHKGIGQNTEGSPDNLPINVIDIVKDSTLVIPCEDPTETRTEAVSLLEAARIVGIYVLPYTIVYFFQYIINQALFELIQFNIITIAAQFRWLNFVFLFSNLIFRIFSHCIRLDCLWFMAFLQALNFVVLTTVAIYGWVGHGIAGFSILVIIVFWEGAVAGVNYSSTFRRIHSELSPKEKKLSLPLCIVGEAFGITVAGFSAIPFHDAICTLPYL